MDDTAEKCAVCSEECKKVCSKCRKTYYCSLEHQKLHWKQHKEDCFPAKLIFDEKQGRHFVASCDLKPGDLIFKDNALVCGPSGAEPFLHKICLGCYKAVKGPSVCSKCFWPCCSLTCASIPQYAEFECKIFVESKVLPFFIAPVEYDFIKILRTLLLRKLSPSKWEQILTLSSHPVERAANEIATYKLGLAFSFITGICHLDEFDIDTVSHVFGAWNINSFGANPPSLNPDPTCRLVSFLFPKTSLASHSCVANTRGILRQTATKDGLYTTTATPTFRMELRASMPIQSGQPIFITYADVCEGTYERRQILKENYYFSCECRRCADPTEFGTFFSAFRCQNCGSGNILPSMPLKSESPWRCDSSSCSAPTFYYSDLRHTVNEIKERLAVAGSQEKNLIHHFEKILSDFQGKILSVNHWLMIEVEYRLIQHMVRSLSSNKTKKITKRLVELCVHCLSIANLIQPGHNLYRGILMFCLVKAKMAMMNFGRKELQADTDPITEYCKEGAAILFLEPEGSEEAKMANYLKNILDKEGEERMLR